jgi:precorrin-3B C17-methyltransferase
MLKERSKDMTDVESGTADDRSGPMLSVVGLGPGDSSLLAPLALDRLARAEAVVGYGTYLDLVDPALLAGKEIVSTGMMGELERAGQAVDLALSGKRTTVVSGGDAGVYGMAGLVLEVVEGRGLSGRLEVEVVPGIPALCAAAALLGAPLTHDFASVSLSDLLTPWPVIEKRLACAAEGDFVIVLYNPRSKRRSGHLERALEIIGQHRGPDTPAGMVRNAYRQGQEVLATTLGGLDPAKADMLTILIVGNSSSYLAGGRIVTPRGYLDKYGL